VGTANKSIDAMRGDHENKWDGSSLDPQLFGQRGA
jgi:hypothetical protein